MKYLFLVLFLVGCSENYEHNVRYEPSCVSAADRKWLAEFIVKCSEAANPKSDEEGEDLVKQCEWTGRRTICPTVKQCQTVTRKFMSVSDYGSWVDCK
jgi:hypothetical protein